MGNLNELSVHVKSEYAFDSLSSESYITLLFYC